MSWLRKILEEKGRFFRVAYSRKNKTLIQDWEPAKKHGYSKTSHLTLMLLWTSMSALTCLALG